MNLLSKTVLRYIYIIIISISMGACSTDDNPQPEVKNYQKIQSLSIDYINTLLGLGGQNQLTDQIKYPVDIYNYTYPMEYMGKTITASGLVCVPVSEGESFPVVSFQHGTLVAKGEAPSLSFATVTNNSIASLAGIGYMLIIPDLVGFGASSEYFHPYLVKKSNVDAVTAMLSSLSELPDGVLSGSNPNDSLFLTGYSQGGWITLAAMEYMENNNEGDWNLIGTSCGAGPYNPEQLMQYVFKQETYPKPFYLAYVLLSFVEDGTITQGMESYFNPPYADKIEGLFDGSKLGTEIDAELTTNTHDLLKAGLFNYQQGSDYDELKTSFNKNRVEPWLNQTPLLMIHGATDVYIPQKISDSTYLKFVALGSDKVQYEIIPNADHSTAAIPAIARTVEWFQQLRHPGVTPLAIY